VPDSRKSSGDLMAMVPEPGAWMRIIPHVCEKIPRGRAVRRCGAPA